MKHHSGCRYLSANAIGLLEPFGCQFKCSFFLFGCDLFAIPTALAEACCVVCHDLDLKFEFRVQTLNRRW